MNIAIDGKPLTTFAKSSILDVYRGYEYASGISKVKCNLKVRFTLYAKVQINVNTNAKMNSGALQIHAEDGLKNSSNNCSEMAVLNGCSWEACVVDGGDYSYPGLQLAARNVTEVRLHHRYFPANFLKSATTPISPVGQL